MNGRQAVMARLLGVATVLMVACAWSHSADAQVTVFAWQENRVDGVAYHYRVLNQSAEGLLGLEIGRDDLSGMGPRLTTFPLGFEEIDEELIPPDMLGMG